MKYQIVSRHLLRRRARGLLKRLVEAQKAVRKSQDPAARALLTKYRVSMTDSLRVTRAERGPWRWYVVAG